jgi:CheY-like chemotaxis protein
VKGLTQAMSGTISVSSTLGQGTQFQIVLPSAPPAVAGLVQAEAHPAPVQAPIAVLRERASTRSGHILYIEDNEVNVMLVEQLVQGVEGLDLASEPDGTRGVERARLLQPDLILVDMQLPDFDGFEVLRRLRDQHETAHTPCIALSANAMPEDISRALAMGFQDYWTKPINLKAFQASMRELFPLGASTVT